MELEHRQARAEIAFDLLGNEETLKLGLRTAFFLYHSSM